MYSDNVESETPSSDSMTVDEVNMYTTCTTGQFKLSKSRDSLTFDDTTDQHSNPTDSEDGHVSVRNPNDYLDPRKHQNPDDETTARFCAQVGLLLWKNIKLHLRRLWMTLMEIFFPTLFAMILLAMRFSMSVKEHPAIIYPEIDARLYVRTNFSLGYFPERPATTDVIWRAMVMHYQEERVECLNVIKRDSPGCHFRGFSGKGDAEGYFNQLNHSETMRYIIDFTSTEIPPSSKTMPPNVKFLIRPFRKMNQLWNTDENFPFDKPMIPKDDQLDYPFAYIQALLSRAIMDNWKNNASEKLKFNLTYLRFPSPQYVEDEMQKTVKLQLTLFEVLAYMLIAFVYTKNIVQEKELKLKESMKLIGLSLPAYWLSWLLTCMLFILPTVSMFTFVLCTDITGNGAILANTEPSIIYVQLLCYSMALISYSFLISTLVQKSSDGMIVSGLFFLLNYVPFEVISQRYKDLSWVQKIMSCLLFNVALGFSNFNIVRRDYNGMGLTWSEINKPLDKGDVTIAQIIGMLLVDTAINSILTWYLDNVYPGDYGVPKPKNFFLTQTYWCGYNYGKEIAIRNSQDNESVESMYMERTRPRNRVGIHAYRLTKRFGDVVSVNNLNLKMFEGEITVLLGHNGAGKTTTMSMLTGFIPPTDGTALVNGYNIKYDIARVRKSLGLCPQHDILYDALTAYEHLWFYSKLKGYKSNTLKQEIRDMLNEVGFQHSSSALVSTMSAGQKRSLSVGIALIGDSKVVILDEPSSGMDPSTRRATWDVLKNYRHKRTMLLTTHYMDEADALGDRIAIMANGELQCCGSSMFLKKLYGTGMHVLIEGNRQIALEELIEVMAEYVPDYSIESNVRNSICFLLPEQSKSILPELFSHITSHKEELGIRSIGTRTTTMEEVFLKSEKGAPERVKSGFKKQKEKLNPTRSVTSRPSMQFVSDKKHHYMGMKLTWHRIKAQLKKRFIVAKSNYITTIAQFILPALFYLIFIFVDSAMVKDTEREHSIKWFNLDDYGTTNVLLDNDSFIANEALDLLDFQENSHKVELVPDEYIIDRTYIPGAGDLKDTDLRHWILEKYENTESLYRFDRKYIVGARFRNKTNPITNDSTPDATVIYNAQAYHSLFVANEWVINTFVRHFFDDSYSIENGNYPLNKTGETEMLIWFGEEYRSAFFVGLFIGIGFCIYTSLIVHYLLRERVSGVKHMHAMFGVGMISYWLPTFMWDLLCFLPPTCLLFTIFNFFEKNEFLDDNNWLLMFFVMFMYSWSSLPYTYAMHFGFETPSAGLVAVVIINLFCVVFSDIMVNEFNKPGSTNKNIGDILDWIFSATIPAFNLSQCFGFTLINYQTLTKCKPLQAACSHDVESLCCANNKKVCKSAVPDSECFKWTNSYLDFQKGEGIGGYIVMMLIQGIVSWVIVFLIEVGPARWTGCCLKETHREISTSASKRRISSGDEMVDEEKDKILSCSAHLASFHDSSLIINGLQKVFGDKVAVDNVYVTASSGECVALLGQSGAGKTTLFRMLTGQTVVSSGNAYLNGFSVRTNLNTVQEYIGYCPQFDAHIPEMTAYETLGFYAKLRGIPNYQIPQLVNHLISWVLLDDSAVNKCGTYSGGNRRKLSLAIALVGDPPYIFLDEPSSGMDPKARRQMWNVLSEIRDSGRTIVLTSHSMEECEALSTNLAIMMNGRFLCMGSPQQLKHKYGQGYTIIIKEGSAFEDDPEDGPTKILDFIKSRIPDTKMFDQHPGFMHIQITNNNVDIGVVFGVMEQCKTALNIEDYSVNETTLEQIFLTFTMSNKAQQTNIDEETKASCWNLQAGFFDDKFWRCGK